MCENTEGSYLCSCRGGYSLNEDNRTCSISCGERLTEATGSFHSPDWPLRYPHENFQCEWEIEVENMTDFIIRVSVDTLYRDGANDHVSAYKRPLWLTQEGLAKSQNHTAATHRPLSS